MSYNKRNYSQRRPYTMTFNDIYAAAMRYLAMREHSQLQLQQKLRHKFPDAAELIQTVLDHLSADNYQSEQRFAEAYVRSRALKGYGPVKIQYELQQRGINTNLVAETIRQSNMDWLAIQEKARQKKFGPTPMPKEFATRAKQLQYLQQRGF